MSKKERTSDRQRLQTVLVEKVDLLRKNCRYNHFERTKKPEDDRCKTDNFLFVGTGSSYSKLLTCYNKNESTDAQKVLFLNNAYKQMFISRPSSFYSESDNLFFENNIETVRKINDAFVELARAAGGEIATSERWAKDATASEGVIESVSKVLSGPAAVSAPNWALADTFLRRGVPAADRVPASEAAKEKLYGGDPDLPLSPLQMAVLGHSFDRDTIGKLIEEIDESSSKCRSMTLRATHGTGLSLSLSQLVRDLCGDQKILTLSVIGDPEKSRKFLESLDHNEAQQFANWANGQSVTSSHLALVVDDASESSPKGLENLFGFMSECQGLFAAEQMPRLTFVLGWFGGGRALTPAIFDLTLTESDLISCYEKMTEGENPLISCHVNGAAGILRSTGIVRSIGSDAQSLIDFMLENGATSRPVNQHWLAKVDQKREGLNDPLTLTAAAQALNLAIPDQIACRLFLNADGIRSRSTKDVVATSPNLTITHLPYPGVALSCPRRANSILARTVRMNTEKTHAEWLDTDCIERDFSTIVTAALASYEANEPDAEISLDFARHIFQRLGKSEFLPFIGETGKGVIADRVAACYRVWVTRLAGQWPTSEKIKWAATMSSFLKSSRHISEFDRVWQRDWAAFVTKICLNLFQESDFDELLRQPDLALRVLKAIRRLFVTKHFEGASITLMNSVRLAIGPEALLSMIDCQLRLPSDDSVFRANELLHQWCRFEETYDFASRKQSRCEEISTILSRAEAIFDKANALLDPGSLIEFSRYVWVDKLTIKNQKDALEKKLNLLYLAEDSMDRDPRKFASWDAKIQEQKALVLSKIDQNDEALGVVDHG
jgi:hypothetical protein